MTRRPLWVLVLIGCMVFLALPVQAGIIIFESEDGTTVVEVGGRIQVQYLSTDPSDGDSKDTIFFRRLRPYIAGTVTENWFGKIQVDFGKSIDGNEVAVKDAYMQYRGWDNLKLTIGNSKTPFSRENLASSQRQQTVERGFVGDHNFGNPDRQLGLKLEGNNDSKKITWAASLGGEHLDPDARRIDFDTPANDAADWNEGLMVAGRVDFHPKGFMKFDQGDFHTDKILYNFSLAAFNWSNDDDNNTYTDPDTGLSTSTSKADVDSATGFELSAGLRGKGCSFDIEFDMIEADLVDGIFTGGMFRDGQTDLDKFQIEGGYMIPGNTVEIAGKWQFQDADNFEERWEATEVGLNYFWNKYKAKAQLTYRMGENVFGVKGDDLDTVLVQFQFVF